VELQAVRSQNLAIPVQIPFSEQREAAELSCCVLVAETLALAAAPQVAEFSPLAGLFAPPLAGALCDALVVEPVVVLFSVQQLQVSLVANVPCLRLEFLRCHHRRRVRMLFPVLLRPIRLARLVRVVAPLAYDRPKYRFDRPHSQSLGDRDCPVYDFRSYASLQPLGKNSVNG